MDKLYGYLRNRHAIYAKFLTLSEEVAEKLSTILSIRIETNWTILLAIFVINASLYYLCDQMNSLIEFRQQPDVEDAEDEEEIYSELTTTPAKPDILPGDETITTVEILDKDENGCIKLVPVTLTARLSRKIIDYRNSLSSLWTNMFVNRASAATIEKQLDAMREDLDTNMISRAPYQIQAGRNTDISDSFLDLLQRTTAEQCRHYGSILTGFLHMRIGYMFKDTENTSKTSEVEDVNYEKISEELAVAVDENKD